MAGTAEQQTQTSGNGAAARQRVRGRSTRRPARSSPRSPTSPAAQVAELARTGPRRAARLGGARLRGPRPDPAARAEVAARQRRARHRDDRLGDRQDVGGRPAGRDLLRRQRLRLLGQERREVPRRRARPLELGDAQGQEADPALPAARAHRRHRAVELPADQLVRRLHPRAGRRQQRDPQAVRGHPADVAADARDAAPSAACPPTSSRSPPASAPPAPRCRRGRHDHVHRLDGDRQEGRREGRRDAHAGLAGARRQGPDDRPLPTPTSSAPPTTPSSTRCRTAARPASRSSASSSRRRSTTSSSRRSTEKARALRQGVPAGPGSVDVGAITFPKQMDDHRGPRQRRRGQRRARRRRRPPRRRARATSSSRPSWSTSHPT